MVKYLRIIILLLIFANGIAGFGHPVIRELSTSPFPFNKVDLNKKLKYMTKRKTVFEVKADFKKKWGDLYDYSLITEYKNNKQKLPIICSKHGAFSMSANDHLRGHGCPYCADEKTGERCRMTLNEFLQRAKEVHGNYYDYSLITNDNFVDSHTQVPIVCPVHGMFKQTPNDHLSGRGCYKCGKQSMSKKQALTRDEVVKRCNEIFDNKYDYSLFVEYHSKKDVIQVICPKHGAWTVSVNNHLYRHSGCPFCKRSLGEEKIATFLKEHNIKFKEQYCINNEYSECNNLRLMIDFWLPYFNAFIEYNGVQHYKESPIFDTRTFEQQKARDKAVRTYCKHHNVRLIEIPYTKFDKIEEILKNELNV